MVQTIVRVAWQDQYPKHFTRDQLAQAARDSVIRYALHYGLEFEMYHVQYGQKWVPTGGPFMRPVLVWGYRAEAIVVEPKK